ncbi:Ankyrin repeat domain-containing protein 26 [Chelonia mydas]|uniref:Ankyrin repeat domain-containing protein 26 n=1 Tax=Chelonia mydas TaxID=8469 RepID=M7CBH9_CHEMY|nr:Ankyrin repeat domain-containing protein 26 [Chelonia mydas]
MRTPNRHCYRKSPINGAVMHRHLKWSTHRDTHLKNFSYCTRALLLFFLAIHNLELWDLGAPFLHFPSLPIKMQQELEKSITKELDQATAELETGSVRVSPVGSTDGSSKNLNVDQDPVSRATQQYLDVLKKNYMI